MAYYRIITVDGRTIWLIDAVDTTREQADSELAFWRSIDPAACLDRGCDNPIAVAGRA